MSFPNRLLPMAIMAVVSGDIPWLHPQSKALSVDLRKTKRFGHRCFRKEGICLSRSVLKASGIDPLNGTSYIYIYVYIYVYVYIYIYVYVYVNLSY